MHFLDKLTELDNFGTSKIKKNRTKKCPSSFKIKKKGVQSLCSTDILAIVAWKDAVTLVSNAYAIHSLSNVKSFGKIDANRK